MWALAMAFSHKQGSPALRVSEPDTVIAVLRPLPGGAVR